jgi:16S rRNA (guanine(966)-N(2))-methyltransferase RsmD
MRIISGKYRGKQINPPKGFSARPTTDVAREGLFNILANRVDFESISVLDLFSGTGCISYEFASRGCKDVTAVEIEPSTAGFIRKTSESLGMGIKTVRINALGFIKTCKIQYDLIFADPPYTMKGIETIPTSLLEKGILKPGGIFILEHSGDYNFSEVPGFVELRKYSKVHFSIFEFLESNSKES